MKRFILLSFGFLGWAFYEMSGGADFEPRSVQIARMNPAPQVQEQTVVTSTAEQPGTDTAFVDTDPPVNAPDDNSVTRVSLNLTAISDILENSGSVDPEVTDAAVSADDSAVPQNVGSLTSSADTPAIIPSLINPNDGLSTASYSSTDGDIRIVSGNRVNVRGGPGTNFGVVTKLAEGDAVRVVLDNGDGWVKMQPLDGGPEGWMADFLLTGG